MASRIMYIEFKGDDLSGPARIGRVTFSNTGKTYRYNGKEFQSLKGAGYKANYFDVQSGEHYWISGCKKLGGDTLYPGIVEIDEDVRDEYWLEIRNRPDCVNQTSFRSYRASTQSPNRLGGHDTTTLTPCPRSVEKVMVKMDNDDTSKSAALSSNPNSHADTQEPEHHVFDSGDIGRRLHQVEKIVQKQKQQSLVIALLGLFLGGGGVFGFLQWAYLAPSRHKIEEQAATIGKHDATMKSLKSELDAAKKLGDDERIALLLTEQIKRERRFRESLSPMRSLIQECGRIFSRLNSRMPDVQWNPDLFQRIENDLDRLGRESRSAEKRFDQAMKRQQAGRS